MKLWSLVCAIWLALSLGIGWVGYRTFYNHWLNSEELRFRSDALTFAITAGNLQLSVPWEGQPEWIALEKEFQLSAITLPSSSNMRHAEILQVNSGRTRLQTQFFLDKLPGKVVGEKSSTSGMLPVLQCSRAVNNNAVVTAWVWNWLATFILGVGLILAGTAFWRNNEASLLAALQHWTHAVENAESATQELLPAVEVSSLQLDEQSSAFRSNLNQLVEELQLDKTRSDLVFSNLHEGVLAVDQDARILLINTALCHMLAVKESALDRPVLEIIRWPVIQQMIDRVLRDGQATEQSVEYLPNQALFRIDAYPLQISPKQRGVLMTVNDETIVRRAEILRRDFVTNASHELKTPLAAIRAYAETLQLGAINDQEAAQNFVNNIIVQADRINALIQGMLQLSRFQTAQALAREPFELLSAISPCLSAAQPLAQAKQIALHTELPEERTWITSDIDGFQTICSNLLSNAIRYTPPKGEVGLSLKIMTDNILLTVKDSGIGISEKDLQRIFERFYRASKDRSSNSGGTGLGLAIVKNLVSALGGSIEASSRPNVGSVFQVTLPRNT
ncbi:MAG: hypothetical protein KDB03_01740 [Planctomycetales bacterium]|nr:hypothetical protein [Planctomycetales bacterium]